MSDEFLSGWPANSRKSHLFERGDIISLCRKMMFRPNQLFPNIPDTDLFDGPDDCAGCRKALGKRRLLLAHKETT